MVHAGWVMVILYTEDNRLFASRITTVCGPAAMLVGIAPNAPLSNEYVNGLVPQVKLVAANEPLATLLHVAFIGVIVADTSATFTVTGIVVALLHAPKLVPA